MSQEAGENYFNVLGIGQMLPWESETTNRVVGKGVGVGEMLLLLHRIVTQIDKEDVEYNNVVWVGQMLPQMSRERCMRAVIWVGMEEMLLPRIKVDRFNYNVVWVGQMLPQMSIGGGGRGDMLTIILGEEAGPLMLWRPGKGKKMLEMLKMESEDPHVLT